MLRFENVGMRYGDGPEVLRDISFALEPGSFHFLTGPSGAGKSSLLRLLYLAHRPSRGLITLFGRDMATTARHELPALRRRIGVVFQDFRLLDHLTAFENVALPLTVGGQVVAAQAALSRPPTVTGSDIAQHFGAVAVAHADILETHQAARLAECRGVDQVARGAGRTVKDHRREII